MTPSQIALIRANFPRLADIAEPAAQLFYQRLFQTDPSTAPLFAHSDMEGQGRKLMLAIGFIVTSLDRPDQLLPVARSLAVRHVSYGVAAAQYESVGAALLWTLGEGLGAAFTPELHAAWGAAYRLLSGAMIEAAYPKAA